MATTTVEENKTLALNHFERVWTEAEFDTAVLADGYHVIGHIGDREEMTLEQFRGKAKHFHDAFPDLQKDPIDVIATDGEVVIPYTFTGTHENELMGIPGTGNEVELAAVDVISIEDAQITREWFVADFLRMMRQLGVAD